MNPDAWAKLVSTVDVLRMNGVEEAQIIFTGFEVDFTNDAAGFDISVNDAPKED